MDIVNVSLDPSVLDKVINSMFVAAGFENKDELTLQDFMVLMAEHRDHFSESALQLSGKTGPRNCIDIKSMGMRANHKSLDKRLCASIPEFRSMRFFYKCM